MDILELLKSSGQNDTAKAPVEGPVPHPELAPAQARFDMVSFGKRVREIRKKNNWTLKELSKRSGISQSTLSRVETGQVTLSFDRTHALTTALGTSFTRILTQTTSDLVTGATGWRTFTRHNEGRVVEQANGIYEYLCSDVLNQKIVTGIVTVKARSLEEHGPLVSHPGEEFIYVLCGRATLITEHYEPMILGPGDSAKIDGTMRHAVFAAGEEEMRALFCSVDPRYA